MEVMKVFVNHLALTRRVTGKHFLLSLVLKKLKSMSELILNPLKPLMSLHRLLHHKSKSLYDGEIKESHSEI